MKRAIAVLSLVAACSAASAVAQDRASAKVLSSGFFYQHRRHARCRFRELLQGDQHYQQWRTLLSGTSRAGQNGVNYVSASTSKPSDSFPGLTAIVTGGSPALTGVYYDVAYSRSYDAPASTTGNGLAAGPCTPYAAPTGTTTEYEEGIDIDKTKLNGGAPGAALTDGGLKSIDPKKLIRDPNNGCNPVFPWALFALTASSASSTRLVDTRHGLTSIPLTHRSPAAWVRSPSMISTRPKLTPTWSLSPVSKHPPASPAPLSRIRART